MKVPRGCLIKLLWIRFVSVWLFFLKLVTWYKNLCQKYDKTYFFELKSLLCLKTTKKMAGLFFLEQGYAIFAHSI